MVRKSELKSLLDRALGLLVAIDAGYDVKDQVKDFISKTYSDPVPFYAEGNKGGDYLKITKLKDNLVELEIGHCCVVSLHKIVPVEFLTGTLTNIEIYDGGVENAIEKIGWDRVFTTGLCSQVMELKER